MLSIINNDIETMCNDTFNYFKNINIDGLYLKEKLKKQNPKLLEKYDSDSFLKDINLILELNTNINS